jgi:hypothetical protein
MSPFRAVLRRRLRVGHVDACPVGRGRAEPATTVSCATHGLGVARGFVDELHAGGQPEFGVDMGEVGLHGAR